MYGYPGYGYPYHPYRRAGGIVDVAGGILRLTMATVQAGSLLARTAVENTIWCGYPPGGHYTGCYPCSPQWAHHYTVIEHYPPFPPCC